MGTLKELITKTLLYLGSNAVMFFAIKYASVLLFSFILGNSNPWQSLWDMVISKTGSDFYFLHIWMTNLVININYFGLGFVFMLMDLTGLPKSLRKYKIQPGTNEPLSWPRFVELTYTIIINQFFIGIPFSFVTYQLYRARFDWNDTNLEDATTKELPSLERAFFDVMMFLVIEEILFFYSHYALHKFRFLYVNIHKKHHEWQSTVAYAAIYAHPIEHVVSNLLPPAIGPILCGSHVATAWLWYTLVIVTTLISHSGYHLPFLPSSEAHDFHHLRFNVNYGSLGLLDYLHGTDEKFRENKAYERHITLTSLQSARELFPDN